MKQKATEQISILLIEDDKGTRDRIVASCNKLGHSFEISALDDVSLDSVKASIRSASTRSRFVVVVLDLVLQDSDGNLHYLADLSKSFPLIRIMAYSRKFNENLRTGVYDAGATRYVPYHKLSSVVYAIALEHELLQLTTNARLTLQVLNSFDIGISVHDFEGRIIYANESQLKRTGSDKSVYGWPFWKKYYCLGNISTIHESLHPSGDRVRNRNATVILPVQGVLKQLSISTDTCGSEEEPLAFVQTAKEESTWESSEPLAKMSEVLKNLRVLTREKTDSSTCPFVGVYFGFPKAAVRRGQHDSTELYLYCDSRAPVMEGKKLPRMINSWEVQMPNQSVFGGRACAGWVKHWPNVDARVYVIWTEAHTPIGSQTGKNLSIALVYICLEEKKPALFLEDFRPYWEFIAGIAQECVVAREVSRNISVKSVITSLVASAVPPIREMDQPRFEINTLSSTSELIRKHLPAISCHFRRISDDRKRLVKAKEGFGEYFSSAKTDVLLTEMNHGSARAVSRLALDVQPAISRSDSYGLEQILKRESKGRFQMREGRIAGYINVPILISGGIWGCMCLQFSDDFLQSPTNVRLIDALGHTIGLLLSASSREYFRFKSLELSKTFEAKLFSGTDEDSTWQEPTLELALLLTNCDAVGLYQGKREISHVSSKSRGGNWVAPQQLTRRGNSTTVEIHQTRKLFSRFDDHGKSFPVSCVAPISDGTYVLVGFASQPAWLNKHDAASLEIIAAKIALGFQTGTLKKKLATAATAWMTIKALSEELENARRDNDFEAMFRSILRHAAILLGANRGDFVGPGPTQTESVILHQFGPRAGGLKKGQPIPRGFIYDLLKSDLEVSVAPDVSKIPNYHVIDSKTRAEIGIKFHTPLGKIYLINLESFESNFFSEEHVGLLRLLMPYVEAKVAQAEGRETIALYKDLIVGNLQEMVFVKDLKGRFVFVSDRLARELGAKSPAEVIGKTDADFFKRRPEMVSSFRRSDLKVIKSGAASEWFVEHFHPDHSLKPMHIRTYKTPVVSSDTISRLMALGGGRKARTCLSDNKEEIVGLIGIFHDISKEAHLEKAQLLARSGSILWRRKTGHFNISESIWELLGLPSRAPEELSQLNAVLKYCATAFEKPDISSMKQAFAVFHDEISKRKGNLNEGAIKAGPYVYKLAGKDRWLRISCENSFDIPGDKETEIVLLVAQDVTELQDSIHRLIRGQQGLIVGALSRATLHDAKRPIDLVPPAVDNILAEIEKVTDITHKRRSRLRNCLQSLSLLKEQCVIAHENIEHLRQLSVDTKLLRVGMVSLKEILDHCRAGEILAAGDDFSSRPEIEIVAAAELPKVNGDRIALRVAFGNLLKNAVLYGCPRGTQRRITVNASQTSGGIEVTISDSGPGFPSDVLAHVKEPYSVEFKAQGTGFGLIISKALFALMGAELTLAPGPGAKSSIFFRVKSTRRNI